MKQLSILILLINCHLALADEFYGKKIENNRKSLTIGKLQKKIGSKKEIKTRLEGTIEGVCKAAGCWLTIQNPDGKAVRVTFKDYGFFVPKDIEGKKVIVEGIAYRTTTSVEALRHYAEDAGKSKAEIAKITVPLNEISFEAEGLIVK
jgi:hypothetical protein